MSMVHSYAVGNGDMFSIRHNSDNFTIIDSSMCAEDYDWIIGELKKQKEGKGVSRFISTHPDQDHLMGLQRLDEELPIANFYCIANDVVKTDETTDFKHYKNLRDSSKAFYIYKGCSRRWMNESDDERKSAGLQVLWPDTNNVDFKEALSEAELAGSPNNTSIILKYNSGGGNFLWMGDLETEFMDKIEDCVAWPSVDILFAAHHGRKSGRVPDDILTSMNPGIIVVGEGPSTNLHYYGTYNTILQNSAGTIAFETDNGYIHIYVSNPDYSVSFLEDMGGSTYGNYIGSLKLE